MSPLKAKLLSPARPVKPRPLTLDDYRRTRGSKSQTSVEDTPSPNSARAITFASGETSNNSTPQPVSAPLPYFPPLTTSCGKKSTYPSTKRHPPYVKVPEPIAKPLYMSMKSAAVKKSKTAVSATAAKKVATKRPPVLTLEEILVRISHGMFVF